MVKVDFEKIVNYRSKVGLNPVQSGSSIQISVNCPKIIHIDSPTPDSMCVDSPNYTISNYLLNVSAPKRQKVIQRMSHHSGSEPEITS